MSLSDIQAMKALKQTNILLSVLGVKDLNYEVSKLNTTKTGGYYRDFGKASQLDTSVQLGTSTWDGTKVKVTDIYSGAGVKLKYTYESGDIRILTNSMDFTIGFLVNNNDKVMIWHDGTGTIKCGHYVGGLTSYAPTYAKPSFIDGTQMYYIYLSFGSNNQMNVYFYPQSGTLPTSPNLTFTYTPTTGADNFVSVSSISGTNTQVYEVSTFNVNTSANVFYNGRWFSNTVNSKACQTTIDNGSEIYFDVYQATSITMNVENMIANLPTTEMPYLVVSFDGGSYSRYQVTSGSITVNVPDLNRHSVRVVLSGLSKNNTYVNKWGRNEGLAISGISAIGQLLKTNNIRSTHQILWFGDSITEAYSVTAPSTNGTHAELSFAHLTSHALNVLPIQVGFGGTGMLVGGDAGMPAAVSSINKITNTINANDPKSNIKLIVVDFGTNDTGQNNPTGFQTAYETYIDTVKTAYPGTPILLINPFTRSVYPTQMTQIATDKGLNLFSVTGTVTTTDGVHPDTAGHQAVASQLQTYISSNYTL